jgi:hypothetical protein
MTTYVTNDKYVHIPIKRKTKEILYNSFRPHETWDTFLRRIFEEAMRYEAGCMPNGLATLEGLNTSKSGAKRIEEVVKK